MERDPRSLKARPGIIHLECPLLLFDLVHLQMSFVYPCLRPSVCFFLSISLAPAISFYLCLPLPISVHFSIFLYLHLTLSVPPCLSLSLSAPFCHPHLLSPPSPLFFVSLFPYSGPSFSLCPFVLFCVSLAAVSNERIYSHRLLRQDRRGAWWEGFHQHLPLAPGTKR